MRVVTRRGFLHRSASAGIGAWFLAGGSSVRGQTTADSTAPSNGLSVERFRELHKELAPDEGEPMQAIPWKIAVQDARKLAAEQKKPILMLSRSGHPLGCV